MQRLPERRQRPERALSNVILSDRDIRAAMAADTIRIDPFRADNLQPASIDVRLSATFRVFESRRYGVIDPRAEQPALTREVTVADGEAFVLHPSEFVLGATLERVRLADDMVARLDGKSSLGRLGLLIHSTAGYVDPGFDGDLTLELANVARLPIVLYPGMPIGQLSFSRMASPAEHPYGSADARSKYQGQRGPTPSQAHQDFTR